MSIQRKVPNCQFQVEAYTLYLRLDVKCHLKVCVLWSVGFYLRPHIFLATGIPALTPTLSDQIRLEEEYTGGGAGLPVCTHDKRH